MELSFTQNKSIRKSFGRLKESLSIPNLIEVQKNSFNEFIKKTDQKLSACIEKTGEHKISSFSPFRSLCPVTGQPDIAKIIIKGSLSVEDKNHIANYLGSFFNTNAYHEKCVEEIFQELLVNDFEFDSVEGHFERRGGISIIPVRQKV